MASNSPIELLSIRIFIKTGSYLDISCTIFNGGLTIIHEPYFSLFAKNSFTQIILNRGKRKSYGSSGDRFRFFFLICRFQHFWMSSNWKTLTHFYFRTEFPTFGKKLKFALFLFSFSDVIFPTARIFKIEQSIFSCSLLS